MTRSGLFLCVLLWCLPSANASEGADALFAATLTGLDGQAAPLSVWKGVPLMVNFWARWCAPCRQEIPAIGKLRARHHAEGLEVIGIAIEDDAEAVRDFVRAYEMSYPVFVAKEKSTALMRALGNGRALLPFTVFIDRQGQMVGRKLGPLNGAELDAAAQRLLP